MYRRELEFDKAMNIYRFCNVLALDASFLIEPWKQKNRGSTMANIAFCLIR